MRSAKLTLLRLHVSNQPTFVGSEQILAACAELEEGLNASSLRHKSWFAWQAMSVRSSALLVQQKDDESMDAFRAAYRIFVSSNEPMLSEMIALVTDLICSGASEAELLGVLRTDVTKADALAPLIVALGERAGESFSVPVEIREVATDIGNLITIAAESSLRRSKHPSSDL